ncbi:hypothetical protein [Corynebacterium efficiens YS-314]|uniref:Uncharacterized protein n=1 Tax=Corynebacterium efficiens (strain DSM 44549 / YS-314 / AJ 12310 / JCM 11189 / NBRC 100395) TaxID=196164 RepID=Q8FPR8_COREF|nr:hypothetical protein [Corynebacterium efficiens YS-314]
MVFIQLEDVLRGQGVCVHLSPACAVVEVFVHYNPCIEQCSINGGENGSCGA